MAKILGAPKQFEGKITISRPVIRGPIVSGGFSEIIHITIDNAEDPHMVLEMNISLDEFARALTGQGHIPGTVFLYPNEEKEQPRECPAK